MTYSFYSDDICDLEALKKSASLDRYVPNVTLNVKKLDGALIIPSKGLYLDGHILKDSYWGGVVDEKFKYSEISHDFECCNSTVYYIGTFHPCWGHDITDGTRLLWGMIPEIGGIKLNQNVKFAYSLCDGSCQLPANFKQLLSYFGITDSNLLLITKPTKFHTVYLADESYWYDIKTDKKRTYSTVYKSFFDELCKRIVPNSNTPTQTIYLSRSMWRKGNPDFGEFLIEAAIKKQLNCKIIHPENLTFSQMVTLLQQTKTLITTEGSISHNALFLQPGTNLIILRKAGFISYYQLMINQLKNLNITYIDAHRTHHFYDKNTPYYGPFFLFVNKALARFLGIQPKFPLIQYLKYRWHIVKWHTKVFVIQLLLKVKCYFK